MKKCSDCNVEMIEGWIEGQHPFEIGVDGRTDISVHIKTGEKRKFLGLEIDSTISKKLKARICPKCGKVETYIEIDNKE